MARHQLIELIRELHSLKMKMLDGNILRDGMDDYARMNYLEQVLAPYDIVGTLLSKIDDMECELLESGEWE